MLYRQSLICQAAGLQSILNNEQNTGGHISHEQQSDAYAVCQRQLNMEKINLQQTMH